MTNKPLVIYHADCTDGFGAAFAAHLKLGDEAEYLPVQYGNNVFPDYQDREVYILDFSFPHWIMEGFFNLAKRVVWLDHHKTAFEMWCGKYEKGMIHINDHPDDKHCIRLDDNKSGALLAWEYFHPGTEVPMLIQHIDDRDRWQFKLEGSKELHAALASYKPWSFEQWVAFNLHAKFGGATPLESIIDEGYSILRAQDAHVQSMLKQARKCYIREGNPEGPDYGVYCGLAINAPIHQSEIGHELANTSGTYGLVFYLAADMCVKCSLRSNGEYDVSAIARALGGGGHRNAAGFETDIETLMGWLE